MGNSVRVRGVVGASTVRRSEQSVMLDQFGVSYNHSDILYDGKGFLLDLHLTINFDTSYLDSQLNTQILEFNRNCQCN